LAAFHSLYVPNTNSADGVFICPDASNLADVVLGCANQVVFSDTEVDGNTFKTVGNSLASGVSVTLVNAADDGGALAGNSTDQYRIDGLRDSGAGNFTALQISGTCRNRDDSADCVDDGSNEIRIAINGTLLTNAIEIDTTVDGNWSIVTEQLLSAGDVMTVFINEQSTESAEAVAVHKYDGTGDILGLQLFQETLVVSSDAGQTLTNTDIASYDNSVSGDEDVFVEVDANNDLIVDFEAGHDERLVIASGATYQPDAASSGNIDDISSWDISVCMRSIHTMHSIHPIYPIS
jgi:hypothetical protein